MTNGTKAYVFRCHQYRECYFRFAAHGRYAPFAPACVYCIATCIILKHFNCSAWSLVGDVVDTHIIPVGFSTHVYDRVCSMTTNWQDLYIRSGSTRLRHFYRSSARVSSGYIQQMFSSIEMATASVRQSRTNHRRLVQAESGDSDFRTRHGAWRVTRLTNYALFERFLSRRKFRNLW